MLGSTASLIPPIDWAARGSPGWQPGLPTVDLTVLASAAPNGVFLKLDTTIGGEPIEVGPAPAHVSFGSQRSGRRVHPACDLISAVGREGVQS